MNGERQQSLIPWTDLPNELLNHISKKLHLCDYLNFRLVCPTWREAAKQLRECLQSPLFMLACSEGKQLRECLHTCPEGDRFHRFICPFDGRRYKMNQFELNMNYRCLGSLYGWLSIINDDSSDTIFLFNPTAGVRIDLPQRKETSNIAKVALSSAPTDPDCTIFIQDESNWSYEFCRVGDKEWRKQELDSGLIDALAFRGKYFLLCLGEDQSDQRSTVAAITSTHLKLELSGVVDHLVSFDWRITYCPSLVECDGEMLLVVLGTRMTEDPEKQEHDLKAFKLDLSTSSWVEMKKIGNRVLFVGFSCSVSFSATELGCRENQIYFIDPQLKRNGWWVFDMEDGSCRKGSSFPLLNGVYIQEEPMWITPSFI